MRYPKFISFLAALSLVSIGFAQQRGARAAAEGAAAGDPIKTVVGRLDLQHYKNTIRGLTKFGDRRQGTDRNKQALDWIEAQLKSYGCLNTERVHYVYQPAPPAQAATGAAAAGGRGRGG